MYIIGICGSSGSGKSSLCEELQSRGVRCDYIYCAHPSNAEKIARFQHGELDVLINTAPTPFLSEKIEAVLIDLASGVPIPKSAIIPNVQHLSFIYESFQVCHLEMSNKSERRIN